MNKYLILLLFAAFAARSHAQIYSFETPQAAAWSADGARLSYSQAHYKLGRRSLRIDWRAGAVVRIGDPQGLAEASASPNGGVALWIYNERPAREPLRIVFRDTAGGEACSVACGLDFTGWRCVWNKFREDMGLARGTRLTAAELHFPETGGGRVFLDCMEFTRTVSWQKMSDRQVAVHRTDFSLIPDFMKYRLAEPDFSKAVAATAEQIGVIVRRLEAWYLGSEAAADGPDGAALRSDARVRLRSESEAGFIRRGVAEGMRLDLHAPLFPMRTPAEIDGCKTRYFMDVNKRVLLPLALDWRKNDNRASLRRALAVYDWFADQGWADGSAMGSLTFEKLRSAGYFHSLFLLRDRLPAATLRRELATLRWLTMFGICYPEPEHPGEVADNLRALALPKLVYALLLPAGRERCAALTAYRDYLENALDYGPGYFGTLKADGSGYHHRGPYNSAYYPHALYVGALAAYLLHDTPYALSETTLHRLKRGLLTFRFFSAGLRVPAGTVGRFPEGQEVLQELLPAFAYAAYAFPEPDAELIAAAKRLAGRHPEAVDRVMGQVDSDLSYTATVGEAELLAAALRSDVEAEAAPRGVRFMPYSGLLTVRDERFHFNVKGFSRYIWDFESSDTENRAGRYLSNGHIEWFDLTGGGRSFRPDGDGFDWSLIPGTTAIRLTADELRSKKHRKGYSDHRNFSDETFLAGVAGEGAAMFSCRLHDCAYDGTLRANKSVFFLGDAVLCIGSDIRCDDAAHAVVTTLFQSPDAPATAERVAGGALVDDGAGMLFAVQDADPTIDRQGAFTRARIDHGAGPRGGAYRYYMLPDGDRAAARRLLSPDSPVEIVRQDDGAHIVRDRERGNLFAALYDADAAYAGPVVRVNVPLAYIWQPSEAGFRLTLCEPDMRRPAVRHMGLLTEEQVVVPERSHATRLTLDGLYDAASTDAALQVTHADGRTVIGLETVRGGNYAILLTPRP